MLTARPALSWPCWPCAMFASRRYNAIRCHGRYWRWEHARTHGRVRAWVVRGVGGVGTHAVQHWVQRQVSAAACGWQSTNKSRVNQSPDW